MKAHGELTAKIARQISKDWNERGYDVLYDHGSSDENVGKIVSWFGSTYNREAELGQLDIAIVEKSSDKATALIEIEETNDRPKTFLGDLFGVLLGDHICFGGKRSLSVDADTTLIVLGKSKVSHEKRNRYLREKVIKVKSSLSKGNSVIRKVVIETFSDEEKLSALLPSMLDRAFKGEL